MAMSIEFYPKIYEKMKSKPKNQTFTLCKWFLVFVWQQMFTSHLIYHTIRFIFFAMMNFDVIVVMMVRDIIFQ